MPVTFLNLTHRDRTSYPKHFLSSVHTEFRISGWTLERVRANEAILRDKLSKVGLTSMRPVVSGSFNMERPASSSEPVKVSHQANVVGLNFFSDAPKREFQIWGDRIVLADYKYESFESYTEGLQTFAQVAIEVLGECQITKVGLRKINSIVISPVLSYEDAFTIFNPALFALTRSGLVPPDCVKGSEDFLAIERDEYTCFLRSNLIKRSEAQSYQASLDFDLISSAVTPFQAAIRERLPYLNLVHFDLFMWAVTEDLIKLMEGK